MREMDMRWIGRLLAMSVGLFGAASVAHDSVAHDRHAVEVRNPSDHTWDCGWATSQTSPGAII
jgi:hypothetical protein